MRFQDPQWLSLLLLLIPWLLVQRTRHKPALGFADAGRLAVLPETGRARLARLLPYLRALPLALAILALARPQGIAREAIVHSRGVDLVVALDLSSSMLAEDARVAPPRKNRLDMAKAVLAEFLRGRAGDRIGLVAFAARPYPAAPLTLDHDWLQASVANLRVGAIEDGTALGDAILAAVNRLRGPAGSHEQAASQAIILITDGRSNAGATSPVVAAAAAKALGIRIHSIGIGSHGPVVVPIESPLGGTLYHRIDADLDETTLRAIAATTGGGYFRADDRDMLARVFRAIDRLEKRPVAEKVRYSYSERFPPLLLAALLLALAERTLRATLLRSLP